MLAVVHQRRYHLLKLIASGSLFTELYCSSLNNLLLCNLFLNRQIDEEHVQEKFSVVGLDGQERFLRSIEIQTEWSIKEDNLPIESNDKETDEKGMIKLYFKG